MSTTPRPGNTNPGPTGNHNLTIQPLTGAYRPRPSLRRRQPHTAQATDSRRAAILQSAFQISTAESDLLDELSELGHGCLEHVRVVAGVSCKSRTLHKAQLQLVMAARQFQSFVKISVRDGLPAWAEVEVESRVARRALKTLKFNEA